MPIGKEGDYDTLRSNQEKLQDDIQRFGLSKDSTQSDINLAIRCQNSLLMKFPKLKLNLPENRELRNKKIREMVEEDKRKKETTLIANRRKAADSLGLPENATWEEITMTRNIKKEKEKEIIKRKKEDRKERIKKEKLEQERKQLGLPEHATEKEIKNRRKARQQKNRNWKAIERAEEEEERLKKRDKQQNLEQIDGYWKDIAPYT
ncbi:hypothetical protein HYW94_03600 [Candidatus Uhrbacteria bacterium]|nr:hypothetical protein [Candidatus Uhrbacteria bacterium]